MYLICQNVWLNKCLFFLFLLVDDEFILVTNLEILLVEWHGRLVIEQVLCSEVVRFDRSLSIWTIFIHILQVIVVTRVGAYVL